jgi:hypothetical protein
MELAASAQLPRIIGIGILTEIYSWKNSINFIPLRLQEEYSLGSKAHLPPTKAVDLRRTSKFIAPS